MSAGLSLIELLMTLGVVVSERRDVHAAILGLLHLDVGAEIGPGGVVELQIAAAGVVERLHRLAIGRRQIVEDGVVVRIELLVDRARLQPEVHHGRRRDAHLRHHLGVGLHELEVLQHRVIGEVDLAGDADALRLGLHTLKLDAVVELVDLDVVETVIEIEVPEHAAVLAVGRALQADLFLLLDDLRDFLVLDLLQIGRADLPLVALRTRLGDRRGAQDSCRRDRRGKAACFFSLGRLLTLRLSFRSLLRRSIAWPLSVVENEARRQPRNAKRMRGTLPNDVLALERKQVSAIEIPA